MDRTVLLLSASVLGKRNAITVPVFLHPFLSTFLIMRTVSLSLGPLTVIVCMYLLLRVTNEVKYVGARWKAKRRQAVRKENVFEEEAEKHQ